MFGVALGAGEAVDEDAGTMIGVASGAEDTEDKAAGVLVRLLQEQEKLWMRMSVRCG